jgi:phenylacetate-CoA ligase
VADLEPSQLQALQLEKLRDQIAYLAVRSPFYADKFRAAGVGPGAVETLASLRRFPLTTKEEIRESQALAPPLGRHACVDMEAVVRVHSSTGTTGAPSWVGLTAHDVDVWTSTTAAVLTYQGLERRDVLVHGAGLTTSVGGLPFKDATERIGATFVPIGTGASERAVSAIRTFGATVLHCTPSYALYLAEYVRERHGGNPRKLGIRKVMCGGEPGAGQPAIRERIEVDWGARATEGMGNADMAPAVFAECRHQAGMHLAGAEWVVPELIDPESEAPVPWEPEAEGELVYTAIDRECCGLVRFRTRDRIRVLGVGCACGRSGPRIRCVGRTDDLLIVLGTSVFPSAIRDVVAELYPLTTGAMQIVLTRPGPRVEPPLRLEAEFGPRATDLDGLGRELERLVRARLKVPVDVRLVPPETLPRSELKTPLVRIEH